MSVRIVDSGTAPGHPGMASVTPSIGLEAKILISSISSQKLSIVFGDAGTIRSLKLCRIDRQPPPSGGVNIQVQLNGIFSDSSIATCVVYASVLDSMASWPKGLRQHQDGWLARQIRIALTQSLDSGNIFKIEGSFNDGDGACNLTSRVENNYIHRR